MRKRLLCLGISMLMLVACFATPLSALAAEEKAPTDNVGAEDIPQDGSYYNYYLLYADAETYVGYIDEHKLLENDTQLTVKKHDEVVERKGYPYYVLNSENTEFTIKVDIPKDAKYGITLDYFQIANKEKDIEISILIDGESPYNEANQISLPRIWTDEIDAAGVPEGEYFECSDKNGNADDIRPVQKEMPEWTERSLINIQGLYTDPYQFFLTKGTHEITFKLDREAVAISNIRIGNKEALPSYSEYLADHEKYGYVKNNGVEYNKGNGDDSSIFVQGEQTYKKNNIVLYATYDNSGASTLPNDPAYTKLNTIGQSNWTTNGDEISWKINVAEGKAGLYKVVFRARQNFNEGMYSYRTLKVNGEIPFEEAREIAFKYQQGWYMLEFGKKNSEDETVEDYYVYLDEGENVFSLTCTTGVMSEVLRNVQQAVLDLNAIYRQIISVTSTEPDIYRDYSLDQQIPTLEQDLKDAQKFIDDTAARVEQITGTRGSQASSLDYVSGIIEELAKDPYVIPERLSSFKSGIETLGSLVSTLSKLALEIDYIVFLPSDVETPSGDEGFLNGVSFTWNQFISSFTIDYNSMSGSGDAKGADVVKVWVSTGRDQAKIISRLISDSEEKLVTSSGKKIAVQLSMVDTGGTLIRATLAGKGPDCALMIGEDAPMNLAARGALVPLDEYREALLDQFEPCAWTPFWYNGHYYALPETQSFDLMFYRTDVLEQFGIEPPQAHDKSTWWTWDRFYEVMEILQNGNLRVGIVEINSANAGISAGMGTFDKFLVQNGGTYYTKNLDQTLFTEEVAYQSFERWVELYSKYGLDRSYDFYSRFRTGEMPLALQNYTSYNQVKTAAPELNGLWTFAPIPGTERINEETGEKYIDISETSVVTGCIMLKSAQEKGIEEAASIFLKWWASHETQSEYARELEATLGVAARYAPANKITFDTLGWTDAEAEIIRTQRAEVTVMNEIPGNYILKRSLTSAFRSVINGENTARRALTIYNVDINDEIKRKRIEFGLE